MLNIIRLGKNEGLSERALKSIAEVSNGDSDHVILRNMPISKEIPKTPHTIKNVNEDNLLEKNIIKKIAEKLGKISHKGIENSIRFNSPEDTNDETWHSHFQFQYSILYCLKGDSNAKTFLVSANQIVSSLDGNERELLLTPFQFSEEFEEFSLIVKMEKGYGFSKYIFDRSDFEEKIKDLDLPDAMKKLQKMIEITNNQKAKDALRLMIGVLENAKDFVVYEPGDVAIVSEQSTIRFSPSFKRTTESGQERWLLAASVN